mmetsp:Transcript_42629/g.69277  ORF Transcript_42629/g.69277 Transcript_42629/m.69277 type:complete len:92 (+) Transcript_42629:766-1041(+)
MLTVNSVNEACIPVGSALWSVHQSPTATGTPLPAAYSSPSHVASLHCITTCFEVLRAFHCQHRALTWPSFNCTVHTVTAFARRHFVLPGAV